MNYCTDDDKQNMKSGVRMISAKKKMPFLSDKRFMRKYGFETVDTIDNDYELLAVSFDKTKPRFVDKPKDKA